MKYILFFSLVCIMSCKKKEPAQDIITPFNYMEGSWERTNDKEGMTTLEHWKIKNETLLEGHAYTLYNKDTIFNERMKLIQKEDDWILQVIVGDEKPTVFKVTSQNKNSFQVSNPTNEFPKEIEYSYFDDVLSAKISGDGTEIPFIFWRVEK